MAFNYGDDVAPVSGGGGSIKQAKAGDHTARIAGFLHLGIFADTYKGQKKQAAPFVCVLFELKDEEDVDDEGNPLLAHMRFPLKKGDKSNLTAFMKVVLTTDEFKLWEQDLLDLGFDDLIGRPVNVKMVGSKAKDDDGNPKYTNLESISSMHEKLAKLTDDLTHSYGHVTLGKYTDETMKALPPFLIYGILEKADNYPGSTAETVLLKLRKDNPEFATKKEGDKSEGDKDEGEPKPTQQREDLDESQDY